MFRRGSAENHKFDAIRRMEEQATKKRAKLAEQQSANGEEGRAEDAESEALAMTA